MNKTFTGVLELPAVPSLGTNVYQYASKTHLAGADNGFYPLDTLNPSQVTLCDLWPYWNHGDGTPIWPTCQGAQYFFPPRVTWTHPQGGLFLWVTLPEGLDMQAIFKSALEQNVAFVPGDSFYANNGSEGSRHMRLNFSNAAPEQIREGIRRLSGAVKSHLTATTLRSQSPIEV